MRTAPRPLISLSGLACAAALALACAPAADGRGEWTPEDSGTDSGPASVDSLGAVSTGGTSDGSGGDDSGSDDPWSDSDGAKPDAGVPEDPGPTCELEAISGDECPDPTVNLGNHGMCTAEMLYLADGGDCGNGCTEIQDYLCSQTGNWYRASLRAGMTYRFAATPSYTMQIDAFIPVARPADDYDDITALRPLDDMPKDGTYIRVPGSGDAQTPVFFRVFTDKTSRDITISMNRVY